MARQLRRVTAQPTTELFGRQQAAVCDAAEQLNPDLKCKVKWPNDIHVNGRKLSGVLIEARPQDGWAVIGIGLNVRTREFPPELGDSATSLALAGGDTTVADIRQPLLEALDRWIDAPDEEVLAAWRARDALRGEHVRWGNGEGTAAGISDSGALIVETPRGVRAELDAGEVHLLR